MFKHATPQPPFPSRDLVEPLRVPVDRENVMYMINGMSRAVDKHFARERENEIRMQESDVSIEESGENTEHSIISVSEGEGDDDDDDDIANDDNNDEEQTYLSGEYCFNKENALIYTRKFTPGDTFVRFRESDHKIVLGDLLFSAFNYTSLSDAQKSIQYVVARHPDDRQPFSIETLECDYSLFNQNQKARHGVEFVYVISFEEARHFCACMNVVVLRDFL